MKRRQAPAGEPAHSQRGIRITAVFRLAKTLDVPEHMIQNAGQRCRADAMQMIRGDRNADDNRALGRINHAGPGRVMFIRGHYDRI
jgi:hypothetical protein